MEAKGVRYFDWESGAIVCVHELKIIAFESEAWISTALSDDGDPAVEDYLSKNMK
jgi:hypothetical protein